MMRAKTNHNDSSLRFLNHFLCAGSSALILSIAHIYPEYWFVSLFALVPFLWRLNRVSLSGSIVLGIILASCYTFVAFTGEILVAPSAFLFKLFCLSLIFSIFGITVNRVRKHIGFNPVFIAALWLPLEYILTHSTSLGNIFALSNISSGFMVRFASLFGFLMLSFSIVLINSLILMFIEHIGRRVFSKGKIRFAKEKQWYRQFKNIIIFKRWYHFLDPRAPPLYL